MRCITRTGAVVLLLTLVGCTKSEDYLKIAREQRTAYRELADLLETIQDEKSMAAAKTALAERAEKCEAIAAKARALPQPPPADVQKRFEEDGYFIQQTIKNLQIEVGRVRGLKGGKEFFKQFDSEHPGLFSTVQR